MSDQDNKDNDDINFISNINIDKKDENTIQPKKVEEIPSETVSKEVTNNNKNKEEKNNFDSDQVDSQTYLSEHVNEEDLSNLIINNSKNNTESGNQMNIDNNELKNDVKITYTQGENNEKILSEYKEYNKPEEGGIVL